MGFKFFKKIGKAVLGGVTLGLVGGHKSKGHAAVAASQPQASAPAPPTQAQPSPQYEATLASIRKESGEINQRLNQSQQQTTQGQQRATAGRIRGGVFGDEASYNNPLNPRLG